MPLQICRVLCHVTWDLGIPTLVSGMWYVYHSDNLVQNRLIYAANEVNFFKIFLMFVQLPNIKVLACSAPC